ncbi:MAG TPA: M50 family metallopeptidase [Candidatus Paceibacterota bacterium]
MGVIVLIIVLAVLILSHEFGHFIVAKKSGIRVDEFGIGFPPRIWGKKIGETIYSINWLPFGGFVRIFGENNEEVATDEERKRSFVSKPKLIQAAVIAAGIIFNLILAWILFSFVLTLGMPASSSFVPVEKLHSLELMVAGVTPNSPAEKAGLLRGDRIAYLETGETKVHEPTPEALKDFISAHSNEEITFGYKRDNNEVAEARARPEIGISPDGPAVGISMDLIGIYQTNILRAPLEGLILTSRLTVETIKGYASIIIELFKGEGREVLKAVSGPVGIWQLVKDAIAEGGMVSLLVLTAFISLSLAVINLIPFPALDGGRLLFLLIEAIKRSPIKPKVTLITNSIGFILLIILLLVVTASDILKLIS